MTTVIFDKDFVSPNRGKLYRADYSRASLELSYVNYIFDNFNLVKTMATFSDETVEAVWQKGHVVAGYNPAEWRKDDCGAWICKSLYGNRNCIYGWEVDHIVPEAKGGSDYIWNLRPLQWYNNASRQDGPLTCPIYSYGNQNYKKVG